MTMAAVKLFQLLEPKLGERETQALIEFVDLKVKENKKEMQDFNLKTLATKEDSWKLKEELHDFRTEFRGELHSFRSEFKEELYSFRTEFKQELHSLRTEFKEDIHGFRTEFKGEINRLELKISDFRSDILRWVFAIFVALMLAIIGLYFKH